MAGKPMTVYVSMSGENINIRNIKRCYYLHTPRQIRLIVIENTGEKYTAEGAVAYNAFIKICVFKDYISGFAPEESRISEPFVFNGDMSG